MILIPRDYQVEGNRRLFEYFKTNKTGNPVLALPTGTGKSVNIAMFLEQAFRMYARQKILVVTHVKELIAQNYEEFLGIWPTAPVGIYSAGLGKKNSSQAITFCGIGSIVNNIEEFGKIDLMIIDECHLLSQDDESMYGQVIAKLKALNPLFRVIGLTATPWREGQGMITEDGIFTDICFDMTTMQAFNWFFKKGHLSPLIPKRTKMIMDVSGVHLRGGEFVEKELQLAVDKDEITWAAIQETLQEGHDRNCWLVFATGVKHANKIADMLNYAGISARCVHSNTKEFKMTSAQRDLNIKDWKEGKYKAIVNNGILTTGVNHKPIDLIVMLRPTGSSKLWVQMLGRGTRPYDYLTETKKWLAEAFPYTKINCLVLDFAGNTKRLGPINDPVIPKKRGAPTGEVPIKECDSCGMYNHISARYCGGSPFKTNEGCGSEFLFKTLIKMNASEEVLIKDEEIIIKVFAVDYITIARHKKLGKPDSVKISYLCGMKRFDEFVLFEHPGWGQRKAEDWWKKRSTTPMPTTTDDALDRIEKDAEVPTHLKVWMKKPYPEIMNVTFTGSFEKRIVGEEVPF